MKLINLEVNEACHIKWEAGQKKYGKEFVGHPLEQLDEEIIDGLNYVAEAERWGLETGDMRAYLLRIREENRRIYMQARKNAAYLTAMRDADEAAERNLVNNSPGLFGN